MNKPELKIGMRARVKGRLWIVMSNVQPPYTTCDGLVIQTGDLILVSTDDWTSVDHTGEWAVTEIYDVPSANSYLLNLGVKGELLWSAAEEREKREQLKELIEQRDALQTQINALTKEIES